MSSPIARGVTSFGSRPEPEEPTPPSMPTFGTVNVQVVADPESIEQLTEVVRAAVHAGVVAGFQGAMTELDELEEDEPDAG